MTFISELEARIRTVEDDRRQLQRRMTELAAVENALQLLLQEERKRGQFQQLPLTPSPVFRRQRNGHAFQKPVTRFLAKTLPATTDEMAQLAADSGIDFHGKKPQKVFHFALIGLQQAGYVHRAGDGVWSITDKGKALIGQALPASEQGVTTEEQRDNTQAATVAGR